MTTSQRWLLLVFSIGALLLLGIERFAVWYWPAFSLPPWMTLHGLRLGFFFCVLATVGLPVFWHAKEPGGFALGSWCRFFLFLCLLVGLWSCYLFEVPYMILDSLAACGRAFFYR